MSIYGPRLRLPKIRFPKPELKINKKRGIQGIIGIIIIILILFSMGILFSYNEHISVSWENNPLYLNNETNAILTINLTNTHKNVEDINLEVTTKSKELIIFCPHNLFDNVEPGNEREISCIIRRNPNEKIFSGEYTITIKTNIGEAKTILQVVTN